MTSESPFVDWTKRLYAARSSIEQALGLERIEADAEHVRAEAGSTPITRLPEDGSWGGEALDVASSLVATNLSGCGADGSS